MLNSNAKGYSQARVYFNLLLPIILGLGLAISVLGGAAMAQGGVLQAASRKRVLAARMIRRSVLPLTYAHIVTGDVPVYGHPSHAALGEGPVRSLGTGYLWVSLASTRPQTWDGQLWYSINQDEYIQADQLAIYRPSTFQGISLSEHPKDAFGWIVYDTWASSAPAEIPEEGALFLPRYTLVTIYETRDMDDWTWYRIGKHQWIEQRTVGLVQPSSRPDGVKRNDKWIEIDLYEQTLAAYEGNQMVYATLVSSGLSWWETEQGLFQVWAKVKQDKMSGREGHLDYYFLEDVPWTIYFNRSYALHAAYWHDRFGYTHSHGCVNMPPKDAKWLFDWATPETGPRNWTVATDEEVGTWVWVHE